MPRAHNAAVAVCTCNSSAEEEKTDWSQEFAGQPALLNWYAKISLGDLAFKIMWEVFDKF